LIKSQRNPEEAFEKILQKEIQKQSATFSSYPYSIGKKSQPYASRTQKIQKYITQEFKEHGFKKQIERDAKLWFLTLKNPGNKEIGGILKRIFTVLRFGELMFTRDSKKWNFWSESGWPISTSLSHGGRVIIQTPKLKSMENSKIDATFWEWLITGQEGGVLSNSCSLSTSGQECEDQRKLLFKRTKNLMKINHLKDSILLPKGYEKHIEECKCNLSSKNEDEYTNQHWGMNISLGGHDQKSVSN
jgi:hypothetical protein